jgi:hypothetical protein
MTTKKPKQKYTDVDGIRRGWYVYLHKANETEQIFYVGMGTGKRAWDKEKRNRYWKDWVANLTYGWSVEILKDDLSEIEAEDLEAETIEKYGGVGEESPLANIASGARLEVLVSVESLAGEPSSEKWKKIITALSLEGVACSSSVREFLVALTVMDDEQLQESLNTLSGLVEEHGPVILEEFCGGFELEEFDFISGTRDEQLRLLIDFNEKHETLLNLARPVASELEDSDIYTVSTLGGGVDLEMNTVELAISNFQASRISWQNFCELFSESFQTIRYDLKEMHDELQELDEVIDCDLSIIDEVLSVYTDFLNKITV